MFVALPGDAMVGIGLDAVVLRACEVLSLAGVPNYLHYTSPRVVEMYSPPRLCGVLIDYANTGVHFYSLPRGRLVRTTYEQDYPN